MPRFLFLAKPTVKSGRIKGDPVGVFKDSHIFGEREDKSVWLANGNQESDWPGTFCIVDVAGVSLKKAQRIMEIHKRQPNIFEPEFQFKDDADKFVRLGRHRWNFDIDGRLLPQEKDELEITGKIRITKQNLNSTTMDRSGLDDNLVTAAPKEV